MNQIMLVGRLVSDPQINELKPHETKITLAITRSYKNEEGLYDTDFVPVVLHNTLATTTTEYCKKGDLIGIKGRIETNIIIDPLTLDKKRELIIIADKVTFLSQNKPQNDEGEI